MKSINTSAYSVLSLGSFHTSIFTSSPSFGETRYDVIVAIGPDGKVKWISELFLERKWLHIVNGKDALYLVLINEKRNNDIIIQALGYDGRVRYEFKAADDYWNYRFLPIIYRTLRVPPIIDKDDTLYMIFSNKD
jgi:hypothetical protein